MLESQTTTVDRDTGEIVATRRMPPEIGAAVISVTKQVKQLGKDQDNRFARYKYVSVDKFYEEIGQLMAAAGLFVVVDETAVATEARETVSEQGQVKTAVWITAAYELTLFHETGAQYGPIHRSIMVAATGPQAFGSGVSYVEKYFLRSLFKVPTGDEDADAAPQEGLPERANTKARQRAWSPSPNKVNPAVAPESNGAGEGRAAFARINAAIKAAQNERDCLEIYDGVLSEWGVRYMADINAVAEVNADAVLDLKRRVSARISLLRAPEVAAAK